MATVATTLGRVGKKRRIIRRKPRTPREQFAARLRELAGERTAAELGRAWGVSRMSALRYLNGEAVPEFDRWELIATTLGLSGWRDLIPPQE